MYGCNILVAIADSTRRENDITDVIDEWTLTSIETPQESVETPDRPHPTTSSRANLFN